MTRLTHMLAAVALTAGGASLVACGRPTHGEMPPLAPRPDPSDPGGAPTGARPGMLDPASPTSDAGVPLSQSSTRGPVAEVVPTPSFQPDHEPAATPADAGREVEPPTNVKGGPADAGVKDSYAPPLPAVPDAMLPDSKLEPSGERMPVLQAPAERMPG